MVMWEQTNISTCKPTIFGRNISVCNNVPSYLIACSFGFNMLFGLPANCYILWLSVKEMIRGQSTEIFVINAALVEVIFSFCFISVIRSHFGNCAECIFVTIFHGMLVLVGRPLFQSCICVERYLGVLHPLIFLKLKPMKYRIACSAGGWILIIGSCTIVAMDIVELRNILLLEYLVFVSVKVYSSLKVQKALLRLGPGENFKQREGVNKDKIKAFRIMQIVLVSAMFTYCPIIFSLLLYYVIHIQIFYFLWSTALCFGIISGFVQPFLYLKRFGKLSFCSST